MVIMYGVYVWKVTEIKCCLAILILGIKTHVIEQNIANLLNSNE